METPDNNVAEVEYFDLNSNDTPGSGDAAVEVVDPVETPEPTTTNAEPKDDPKRLEYWQSRADKMAQRNKELERLEPLEKLLNERQDIVDVIKEKVSGKPAQNSEPELVRPVVPTKPSDYDSVAAVSDPDSPSFKYRTSLETYQESIINYFDKKESLREQQFQRTQVDAERRLKAAEADTKLRTRLQEKGIIGAEQDKFIQIMDSPETFHLDNLIKYYEVVQGKGAAQTPKPIDPKVALMQKRNATKVPLPAGIEGGDNPSPVEETDEDMFNAALMAKRKK